MAEHLDDLAGSFTLHLRAENKSKRTCILYGQSVRFFRDWLNEQGRPSTLDEMTRPLIQGWLGHLADRNAESTVVTRWKGMRRFCRWLVAEGELATDPMDGMEVPAASDKPVPVLSDEDLAAILKACQGTRFYDRRDEAVIRFLLSCGTRNSELCGLRLGDIDVPNGAAMVLGKGNRPRPVYFSSRTARALDRYQRVRRAHRYAHLDAFFLGERGPLTTDGIREILAVRSAKAGVAGVFPHRLRHTWAHDFLLAGGQERDLKRLAGWSSDAMLERYGASAADHRARAAALKLNRGDRV